MSLLAAPAAQAQLAYITNNNQIVITGCVGGGKVTIPSVTNGLPVTSIGEYAFYDCSTLTSVTSMRLKIAPAWPMSISKGMLPAPTMI